MKRIFFLCILCAIVMIYSLERALIGDDHDAVFEMNQNEIIEVEVWEEGQQEDEFRTKQSEKDRFQSLEEAEKYLRKLLKQRHILIGDFYGINQVGYRYVLIFDRLGTIRYRLNKIDEEIEATRQEISEWIKKGINNRAK